MKIKYLGTAASEGIPAIFCDCKTCAEARKRGGKNKRTRAQALVDDKILIDFNADTYAHCLINNIDLSKINNCLITHGHRDHLYLDELSNRFSPYSRLGSERPFNIYASKGIINRIDDYVSSKRGVIELYEVKPYETFAIDDYKVTALEALHDSNAYPFIYIIENPRGKRLLYAHDTNYFLNEAWEYFDKTKIKLDFVSLDCTEGNRQEMKYIGHMNLNDCKKVRERLLSINCADNNTVFCLNHFSHNGVDVLYEEFSEIAGKQGFIVSYDGMIVEF